MIRVILADDHQLVRQGIRSLLERAGDIEVVGEADDGLQAIELAARLQPDVAMVDIAMPRLDGMQAIQRIIDQVPQTRLIVLSMHADDVLIWQVLQLGASGYLLKDAVADELLLAVRAAQRGELYLSSKISAAIKDDVQAGRFKPIEPLPPAELTAREREVLQLIAEGQTNHAIAHILGISPKTVEKHRSSLMTKLQANSLATLIQIALERRLIFPKA